MTNEAGLQFEGVPSERAKKAIKAIEQTKKNITQVKRFIKIDGTSAARTRYLKYNKIVLESLALMAKEKVNG